MENAHMSQVYDLGFDLNDVEESSGFIGKFDVTISEVTNNPWPSGDAAVKVVATINSPRTYKYGDGKEVEIVGKAITIHRLNLAMGKNQETGEAMPWTLKLTKQLVRACGLPLSNEVDPQAWVGKNVIFVTSKKGEFVNVVKVLAPAS
jgi:hypothetical protein